MCLYRDLELKSRRDVAVTAFLCKNPIIWILFRKEKERSKLRFVLTKYFSFTGNITMEYTDNVIYLSLD